MKPPARITSSLVLRSPPCKFRSAAAANTFTLIHTNASRPANVVPIHGTGPPPEPPLPASGKQYGVDARVARRRRQAEMLRQAKELRSAAGMKSADKYKPLRKRFWKEVHVKEVDGAYEVHLDTRPLRRPDGSKEIVRVPLSKPQLAHALALEWDLLTSAQQATRQHFIPLTSLICRALDIADDDDAHLQGGGTAGAAPTRTAIVDTLLRYLDTDSLLCLSPSPDPNDPTAPSSALNSDGHSLRAVQEQVLADVSGHLTTLVWPGIRLKPALDGGSILPEAQEPEVREIVRGWISGLGHWELAGLERATLAGKGLLGATRLLVEWSEGIAGTKCQTSPEQDTFGVEEAARAASIEVDWQIDRWGEVEDTHDVEKEDIRRQLGSVVLLVSGTGKAA